MMTFYQSISLVKEYLWLGFNFIPCVELEIPGFQEMHIPQTTSGTITTKLREVLTWELENVDLMLKRAWKWIIKHYITKRYIIIHQKIVYRWLFCKGFELGKKIFKSFLIRQKFAFSKNRHTKKRALVTQEKNLLLSNLKKAYHWRLKGDSITVQLKENPINDDRQELQDPQ